jgi:cysteine desulfurase
LTRGDVVYLDNNASTPLLPRVREAVLAALDEGFGNPSADHAFGRRARAIVEAARAEVAALLGAAPDEIVFTGGGTEANNLALRGLARASKEPSAIVTSDVEHPAVERVVAELQRAGWLALEANVGASGAVSAAEVARLASSVDAARPVVSLLLAQNETGVLQPVAEVARLLRGRGAIVHTDAAQAVGKIDVDVRALGVDLLSVAGHKLYAPKGVGALFVKRGVTLAPLVVGAGHERGLRPGTENVASIAGLGAACAIAREDLGRAWARQRALRDRLEAKLAVGGFVVHGASAERLPNTVNGRFPGVRGSAVLARCEAIAASTGSACHAGEESPSRVLLAMGVAHEAALGAIRLSLGRATTEAEIDRSAEALLAAARRP